MSKLTKSEEELGQRVDRCIQDTVIKTASGIGLGIIFSVVLFKRRPWPVIFGTGMGLGMSYSNCQHDFQAPFQRNNESTLTVSDPKLVEAILKENRK